MNKYYITNAIPYPNGKPHLGFALEVTLSDVLARYHRALGEEVKFLTGVDEHGLKVFQAAQKEGLDYQAYVDKNSQPFRDLKDTLDISFDDFIRTSDQKLHWPGAIKLWEECQKSGHIYKKKYTGLYCVGCEEFKNPKDLIDGLCPEHKVAPETVEEENYFFKLTDFADTIRQKIQSDEIKIVPETRKNEVLGLLNDEVEDFSISRPSDRLPWGIPVPGDNTQTMYVWFDALSNYITAIGYGRDDAEFAKWWPAEVHTIGKGIIRFHAIFWPAMLLAAGLPLPQTILVHGYVTIEGEKISKSLGNVITPTDVIDKYLNAEALRYFLLRYIPTTGDGNFSYEEFERVYNADLANGLGNLTARVSKLCEKHQLTGGQAPNEFDPEITKHLDSYRFNEALNFIWSQITEADRKINDTKPWQLDDASAKEVLTGLITGIQHLAYNLQPFLPQTAEKILAQFTGPVKSGEPLFPRLTNDQA